MGYRKITVDNKVYEYVIGKKFTKIKNFGIFENEKIGNPVVYFREEYAHYMDHTPSSVKTVRTGSYVVTPKTVAAVIKGEEVPISYGDKNGTKTIEFMTDPFEAEIYQRTLYWPANYDSYKNLSWEI